MVDMGVTVARDANGYGTEGDEKVISQQDQANHHQGQVDTGNMRSGSTDEQVCNQP